MEQIVQRNTLLRGETGQNFRNGTQTLKKMTSLRTTSSRLPNICVKGSVAKNKTVTKMSIKN